MSIPRGAAAAFVLLVGLSGLAARPYAQRPEDEDIVTTEHHVLVDGSAIRYTARAGRLPIADAETGDVHGRMFFTAYSTRRSATDPVRPLTFVWNGGPGSSSSLVHLLGFGPRRLNADGSALDNQGTWLGATDLVFVDPIGTGYSRPVKAEHAAEFYQTRGDAESVAEFVRVYRNRFAAWGAPLFLAGESYGVTRAAGVADVLERRGIGVSGVLLIGLILPLGSLSSEDAAAFAVPTYTAAAFVNKALAPELQQGSLHDALRQAERWSMDRYAPALARRDRLDEAERQAIVGELARHTGLASDAIDRKTLAISMPQFSEQLLRARNLIVGRYDSRLTAPFDPEQQKMYDPTRDPSLRDIIDDTGVLRYLRYELKYTSDLRYQGPFGGGYPPPTAFRGDWMSVRWNRSIPSARPGGASGPSATERGAAPAPEPEPLRRAMTINPSMKVLVSCGQFDLVCSYYGNEVLAQRLEPSLASRVSVRSLPGGHAIYTDDTVRLAMKADAARFLQDARPRGDRSSAAPDSSAGATPPGAVAQPRTSSSSPSAGAATHPQDAVATTKHRIVVGGKALQYTARAGWMPIATNDTGEVHGRVFYVSYTLDAPRARGARPLSFIWNGGPGANSSLLHLTGFGPRRIRTASDSPSSACECELMDNEATWLDFSDLVFVDPIGTGFSRATRAEHGAEFYNTLGDIASIAEFIRVYRTRLDAWDAPVFIAGESYGVWRAGGVAEALERRGERVAGVILISGGVPVGPVIPDELRTALFIPTRTAAAFHHKKLAADLQRDLSATLKQVETWATTDYAPALKRADSLSDAERTAIVTELARFTGLDASLIDTQTLIVGRQAFAEQLLRDQKKVLGRFDTRDVEGPSARAERTATILRYLHETLQVTTDLSYQGLEDGFAPSPTGRPVPSIGARWNYNQGPQPAPGAPPPPTPPRQNLDAPPGGAQPWLRRGIEINPRLKAFVAFGLYDSLNSCAVNDALVPALEPNLRANITARCYQGGHMMYDEPPIRRLVTKDVAAFVQEALAANR